MNVTVEASLPPQHIERMYPAYRVAFEPLVTKATARHLLSAEEFAGEMTDPRIDKYVAWNDAQIPVALATLTTDLHAVPWIEPRFYTARYPEQAAANALFYLGYLFADPAHPSRAGVTISEMILTRCAAANGMLAWDVCAFNNGRGIGGRATRLSSTHAAEVEILDTQTYYGANFAAQP